MLSGIVRCSPSQHGGRSVAKAGTLRRSSRTAMRTPRAWLGALKHLPTVIQDDGVVGQPVGAEGDEPLD